MCDGTKNITQVMKNLKKKMTRQRNKTKMMSTHCPNTPNIIHAREAQSWQRQQTYSPP